MDASGNTIPDFNGFTTIAYTSGGYDGAVTFYDPVSGTTIYGTTLTNLPITNGTGTFTVKANASPNLTDTFTVSEVTSTYGTPTVGKVSNTAWTYDTASVNTTAQVATSIKVAADKSVISTNVVGQTDNVYAEVDDQTGNPMLTGSYPVTFTVTGSPVNFYGQPTITSTGWGNWNRFSDAIATLFGGQQTSGPLTVTATTGSLTGSLNLTATDN